MIRFTTATFAYQPQKPIIWNCNFSFERDRFYSIEAPSGAGKSTLLNIIGLIETLQEGQYHLNGVDVSRLNDLKISQLRAQCFGFLFQNFRLISDATVYKNIEISLKIAGHNNSKRNNNTIFQLLEQVGLADKAQSLPHQLSGGECQRVAFVRAVAKKPQFLIADEPTGNLDISNRDLVLGMLKDFHQQGGGVIMVTHDPEATCWATDRLQLSEGKLIGP